MRGRRRAAARRAVGGRLSRRGPVLEAALRLDAHGEPLSLRDLDVLRGPVLSAAAHHLGSETEAYLLLGGAPSSRRGGGGRHPHVRWDPRRRMRVGARDDDLGALAQGADVQVRQALRDRTAAGSGPALSARLGCALAEPGLGPARLDPIASTDAAG